MKAMIALMLTASLLMPGVARSGNDPARSAATAAEAAVQQAVAAPQARPDGRRWRIGYVQSGDYSEYPQTLIAIVQGLQRLGWLRIGAIPPDLDGRATWAYIAAQARSDTLEFVEDAYWQPGNFDPGARPALRASLNARLTESGDIDLMIAMGTWAGQDIAGLGPPVPTVVASVSDPVRAGIVVSAEDSGRDNLHARVQPRRYEQQLRLFHDIVPFHSLGVVYEDTAEGRTYAALDALESVARERDFRVVPCLARTSGVNQERAELSVLTCYKRLAATAGAIYVTASAGLTAQATHRVAALLRQHHKPSFAMLGAEGVRNGLLMSMARADYAAIGGFHAATISRILHGERPRQISQIWSDPARIAVNFKTMRLIGFDPPMSILIAADDIFETEDEPPQQSTGPPPGFGQPAMASGAMRAPSK